MNFNKQYLGYSNINNKYLSKNKNKYKPNSTNWNSQKLADVSELVVGFNYFLKFQLSLLSLTHCIRAVLEHCLVDLFLILCVFRVPVSLNKINDDACTNDICYLIQYSVSTRGPVMIVMQCLLPSTIVLYRNKFFYDFKPHKSHFLQILQSQFIIF